MERLVQRAQAGDADAFAALIAQFERTALALAYSIVGNSASAGDVVQDGFLRAWQRLADLNEPARFGAWLCRIVRNGATDVIRRGPKPAEALNEALTIPAAAKHAEPEHGTIRRETNQRIGDALQSLDDLTRSAVVLRYYQDLSSKQIGELLGLSPAAVDMRLSRARNQLREKLAWAVEGASDEMMGSSELSAK